MAEDNQSQTAAEERPTVFAELLSFVHKHGDKSFPNEPHRDDTVQSYLEKLVQAVAEIPETDFDDEIGDAGHTWTNESIANMNESKELSIPEGFVAPVQAKRGRRPKVAANGEAAEAKEAKPKREKKVREKKEREPREARGHVMRKPKGGFTTRSLRRLVIENPNISLDEMDKQARAAGAEFARSTLTVVRQSALITCSIVRECGWTPPATASTSTPNQPAA
jgi:hypothetical protein